MSRYPGKTNAPDFPPGLDWINCDRPLSLDEFRGRIVLLDFWTYCCINCMHIIPDLKALEKKYAQELVVIGVHSAKFTSERDTHNILQAVMRYEIEHPVVNDAQMILWREYGIRAWPSVVVIDPAGKVVGIAAGEGVQESLDPIIAELIAEFGASGQLQPQRFRLEPIAARMPKPLLSFPGKVLADDSSGRLYIADSGHNRIVICTLDGEILDIAGSGAIGITDGSFETAAFHHPQGMCLSEGGLLIADTENHAIRRIDLQARSVVTLAGNGVQSRRLDLAEGPAKGTRLNSPWDMVAIGAMVYVAMAGPHQIWKLDLQRQTIGPFIGSGRETLADGPASQAALAQPSGIASDGQRLYFADSETSSIRWATVGRDAQVGTVVGAGLFDFGDTDGVGDAVRLQHPLGVTWFDGALYVADTYNNKIKRIDPESRSANTLAGGFDQPAGLSTARCQLYVADTNNHLIKVVDPVSGAASALRLQGIERLRMAHGTWSGESIVVQAPIMLRPGAVQVVFDLALPEGCKIHPNAPSRILFSLNDGEARHLVDRPQSFPVEWTVMATRNSVLRVLVELYCCQSGEEALCFFKESLFTVELEVSPGATQSDIRLVYNPLSMA